MASSTGEAPPQLSILRIKRKRTQQPTPLDALVIEQLEQPRSKRRKPSAAAAAPAATDPSHSNRGVFKFAETVPLDSFSTPTKTRSLRDRIQSFLAHPPPGLARSASSSSLRSASLAAAAANSSPASSPARRTFAASSQNRPAAPPSATTHPGGAASPSATASPSRRKLPSALRAARAAAISAASSSSPSSEDLHAASPTSSPSAPTFAGSNAAAAAGGPSPRLTAIHAEKSRLRYRVVEQRRAFFSAQAEAAEAARRERAREDDEIRRGLRPPRVVDSRSLAANNNLPSRGASSDRRDEAGLKIYEAVAEGGPATEGNRPARRSSVARITDAGQNAAMDQFGALLDEYLTLEDHTTPSNEAEPRLAPSSSRLRDFPPPPSSSSAPRSPSPGHLSEEEEEEDDDSDYVYDVYYRAVDLAQKGTSASVSAVTGAAAAAGTAATGWDVSSLAGLDRIGQLAGLTEDSDDEEQLLMNEAAAGGSSEEEDNADQDSNEENDYRNDYPDEDEPDSDNNRQEFRDRQADWSEDESDEGELGGSMQYDSDGDY